MCPLRLDPAEGPDRGGSYVKLETNFNYSRGLSVNWNAESMALNDFYFKVPPGMPDTTVPVYICSEGVPITETALFRYYTTIDNSIYWLDEFNLPLDVALSIRNILNTPEENEDLSRTEEPSNVDKG